MKRKVCYQVNCNYGYSLLGEAPPKMDKTVPYYIVGLSQYFPHCFIVERVDKNIYKGNNRWIVPKNTVTKIFIK